MRPDAMTTRLEQFKELVEPRLARLYRVAYRLIGNRTDAEDLVQETCLLAWEKFPGDAEAAHVDRWLTKVLYHRFVDGTRRRKHRSPASLNDAGVMTGSMPDQHQGPCNLAQRIDDQRLLEHAWAQLEHGQQVLLTLRAEGFDLTEIEGITGIDRQVLRARLHRARQRLVRHLQRNGHGVEAMENTGSNR